MSRLDQHVLDVRNRMTLGLFLAALAWAVLGLAIVAWVVIIVQKLINHRLPQQGILLLIGGGAATLGALTYALLRRPSRNAAAIAIDQKLGLKEKISTAIFVGSSSDPFAQAAVLDAERTANNVSLFKQFPIALPRQSGAVIVVGLAALLTAFFLPQFDLFGQNPTQKKAIAEARKVEASQQFVREQLPKIEAGIKPLENSDAVKIAKAELDRANSANIPDPVRRDRSALAALQDMQNAITKEIANNEKFITAENEKQILGAMEGTKDESTPMGKAHQDVKNGDFQGAMNQIQKAVENFDKLSEKDQQKTVEQAKALAQALSKAANDPKIQQQIASKMMQMGAAQTQAQQMAAKMMQAASGNQQAAQQLQQMAQQATQQMNNGKGPTAQQQQQIQQMMKQMQAAANSQQQAQSLSGATQQMASAMQQACQNPGGSKPGGQQGNKPGGKSGQQQQMANAQQQMQQQLQAMQAQAQDAKAIKAAQDAADQAAAEAANGLNQQNGGDQQANAQDQNSGHGDFSQGDTDNPGQKPGPPGGPGNKGVGGGTGVAMAPGAFKAEFDPTQDIDKGKVLASRYVKSDIEKGESKAELQSVAKSAVKDADDEIDQDRISREAQQAVKDYFETMQKQQ